VEVDQTRCAIWLCGAVLLTTRAVPIRGKGESGEVGINGGVRVLSSGTSLTSFRGGKFRDRSREFRGNP